MKKNKIFRVPILLVLLMNCSSSYPNFVPKYEDLHLSPYGAHIELVDKNNNKIVGEFISINTENFIVLIENVVGKKEIIELAIDKMKLFELTYAQPKDYDVFLLLPFTTISHGYLFIYSAPITILVTGAVAKGGATAFRYDNDSVSLEYIKMFTRFPQGIPPTIRLKDIR